MKHALVVVAVFAFGLTYSFPARCDMFGGDVAVLVQILAEDIEQFEELKNILGTGNDSLKLMRDINQGIRDGLRAIQIVNPKFNPGLYGNLNTDESVLSTITDLYGAIPQTSEAKLEQNQDQSVAETISMNAPLFGYADQADAQSQEIFKESQSTNPQGTAKLTAQSLAILIGITSQMLKTNSMMLKMMGENMALQNRNMKLQSTQFQDEYEGLSKGFGDLPTNPTLSPLTGGGSY